MRTFALCYVLASRTSKLVIAPLSPQRHQMTVRVGQRSPEAQVTHWPGQAAGGTKS